MAAGLCGNGWWARASIMALALGSACAVAGTPAAARPHRPAHARAARPHAVHSPAPPASAAQTATPGERPPIDDLYRRRGTGIGGAMFSPRGQGGLSIAGTCADLRFAEPRSCGHGYGVYGNGLGYGFGF